MSKHSLIFMKGKLKSLNLYCICGTATTGDATVISSSSNPDATNF